MNVSRLVLSCRCKRKRKKIFRSIPQPDRVFSSPCLLKTRELGYFLESSCSQTDKPTRMRCYAVFAQTMAPLRHLGLCMERDVRLHHCTWVDPSFRVSVSLTPTDLDRSHLRFFRSFFQCDSAICTWMEDHFQTVLLWVKHEAFAVLSRKTSNGNEEIKRVRQGVLPFKGTWQ